MKKLIAVILCICILFSCAVTVCAEPSPYGTTLPTVYVLGTGSGLYAPQPDGSRKKIYDIELPPDFVDKQVKGNMDVFAKAFFTQKWDEFCIVLHDVIAPLFDDLRLDTNGEAPNGSTVGWGWDPATMNGASVGGKYELYQFHFEYDFRMGPFKTAEILHRYIEDVLAVTGAEKVNLIGRCLGASITAAYMQKYDGEHIASYLQYNSAMNGAVILTKPFCGEIYLQGDGIERFIYDVQLFADETLNTLLQSFFTMLGKTYGLNIAAWAVNNVYKDIYLKVVPPIVSETFGTFPGYWSMVHDRDYQKAKATVFYGKEEEWQGFMQIIDNYHYNVQVKMPELIRHFEEKGIPVAVITKYGFQIIPVVKDSKQLADGYCNVSDSSWGATTSDLTATLSAAYLKEADMRYVSPDRQIDASTCVLPTRTWFIKNLTHKNFPHCVEQLMAKILDDGEMTVFSDPDFPQYMNYDPETDTIFPQTAENCDTTARYRVTYFTAVKRFWKALFTVIKRYIEAKRGTA